MYELLESTSQLYNEAYFGKSAGIIEIEKCIGQLLVEGNADKYKNLNDPKAMLPLIKAIKKQFGFGEVFVRTAVGGAAIVPLCNSHVIFSLDKEHDIVVDRKSGYYDKFHKDTLFLRLNIPLMISAGLTPSEVTALVLHDIGRNMDYSPYTGLYLLGNIAASTQFINVHIPTPIGTVSATGGGIIGATFTAIFSEFMNSAQSKGVTSFIANIPDMIIQNIPPLNVTYRLLTDCFKTIGKAGTLILGPITTLTVPLVVLLSPLAGIVNMPIDKKIEYADSFAAAYGYASELATAISKIDINTVRITNETLMSIPLTRFIIDLTAANVEIINIFANPRGSAFSRMVKMKKKLESDLASGDFLPEEKAILKKEIERLEFMYETYELASDDEKLKMLKFVRGTIYKYTGGNPNVVDRLTTSNFV